MAGPGDLDALAEEFLDACQAALDTIPLYNPLLLGAPARSFVSPGTPAGDYCDPGQLTVHVQGIGEGATSPGVPKAAVGRINRPRLVATIFRCVPSGEETGGKYIPPAVSALEAASAQENADAWALWNHIFNLVNAGQLFSKCGDVVWQGLRSLAPSGMCGGWVLTIEVSLDGYSEAIGT